jgi:hypothetical protein
LTYDKILHSVRASTGLQPEDVSARAAVQQVVTHTTYKVVITIATIELVVAIAPLD